MMAALHMRSQGREFRYECLDLDAGLQLHAHEPGSAMEHDVRCDEGRVAVFIHPDEVHELHAGETLVFDSTRWHGIRPLTVGARFTNVAREAFPDSSLDVELRHNAPEWALRPMPEECP